MGTRHMLKCARCDIAHLIQAPGRQGDVCELDQGQPAYTGKCIGNCSQAGWNYRVGPLHKQVLNNLKKQRLNND